MRRTMESCDRPPEGFILRKPPSISVIDDDAPFRVATDSLLRARGYSVHAFESAADFLQSPVLDDTSCVITDVKMPDINGLELQTLLRNQGRTVPIIFITAFPEESARARALREGAVCFLSKASDASSLLKYVEAALAVRPATGP
jgi:FixJ family two-component response regulator